MTHSCLSLLLSFVTAYEGLFVRHAERELGTITPAAEGVLAETRAALERELRWAAVPAAQRPSLEAVVRTIQRMDLARALRHVQVHVPERFEEFVLLEAGILNEHAATQLATLREAAA